MKKNKCENCGVDFERACVRRFCSKPCWHKFNAKTIASYNDGRFQWKNCTEEEKVQRIRSRFEDKVIKSEGCWGWKGHLDKNGYPLLKSGTGGKEFKETRGGRISWLIYRGEIPKGKYLLHTCDNPTCTNPEHMFLGTPKENSQDMVAKGRGNKGSKHGNSKLDEEKIKEIRKMYDDGYKVTVIMGKFGICGAHVRAVGNREVWKHVGV